MACSLENLISKEALYKVSFSGIEGYIVGAIFLVLSDSPVNFNVMTVFQKNSYFIQNAMNSARSFVKDFLAAGDRFVSSFEKR